MYEDYEREVGRHQPDVFASAEHRHRVGTWDEQTERNARIHFALIDGGSALCHKQESAGFLVSIAGVEETFRPARSFHSNCDHTLVRTGRELARGVRGFPGCHPNPIREITSRCCTGCQK